MYLCALNVFALSIHQCQCPRFGVSHRAGRQVGHQRFRCSWIRSRRAVQSKQVALNVAVSWWRNTCTFLSGLQEWNNISLLEYANGSLVPLSEWELESQTSWLTRKTQQCLLVPSFSSLDTKSLSLVFSKSCLSFMPHMSSTIPGPNLVKTLEETPEFQMCPLRLKTPLGPCQLHPGIARKTSSSWTADCSAGSVDSSDFVGYPCTPAAWPPQPRGRR